jgi:shikimate dehydrogenase
MHNTAFRELGLSYRYESRSVATEALGRFVSSKLRKADVRGANVTIPHKVTILRHLDEVDTIANKIGAVNTIVNDAGWLKGYNTDGQGAIRSLEEAFGDLKGIKIVILGAGGAARAIGYHLSMAARELVFLNRGLKRAKELAKTLQGYSECRSAVTALGLCSENLGLALDGADIVVNATPVGMTPKTNETIIDGHLIGPHLLVMDLVYNPPRTRLLREAEAAGARTINGIDMLVYQGASAFTLWTGIKAPEALMTKTVKEALKGGLN